MLAADDLNGWIYDRPGKINRNAILAAVPWNWPYLGPASTATIATSNGLNGAVVASAAAWGPRIFRIPRVEFAKPRFTPFRCAASPAQQIRGNCSPESQSTMRPPPKAVVIRTKQ